MFGGGNPGDAAGGGGKAWEDEDGGGGNAIVHVRSNGTRSSEYWPGKSYIGDHLVELWMVLSVVAIARSWTIRLTWEKSHAGRRAGRRLSISHYEVGE